MGDLSSLAARISCAPWQSVHTAAFCEPFSIARPCTLAWYETKACALSPFDEVMNFCPWHRPQVTGMLAWLTGDAGSPGVRTSCALPWQSTHVAPKAAPALTGFACIERA